MNFAAGFAYICRLARGNSDDWNYLPYRLSLMCRGVELSGASVEESGLTEERSYGHRDSGGPDLDKLLRALPISRSDAALDFGCGKAGAMLTLAKYPFARVDGVELSSGLADIARQNLRRMHRSNSVVFSCDAAQFLDLDSYTYFYMYNPFPEIVLRAVMRNIIHSLERRSRNITLIYKNPVFHDVIVDAGFRKAVELPESGGRHPFSVYVWKSVAPSTLKASFARA